MENLKALPENLKIFSVFKHGFETIVEKPYLVLFPLGLDLLILFGPKIGVYSLFGKWIESIATPQLAKPLLEQWQATRSLLLQNIQHYSLTSVLSTKPLGIPSLFSTRLFESRLLPTQPGFELTAFWQVLAIAVLFFFIGIGLTLVFYSLTAQGSNVENKTITFRNISQKFPRFLAIPFVFLAFVIIFFLPGVFIVSFFTVIFPALGGVLYAVLVVVFFSFLTPLLFTPHAIINHEASVRNCITISRSTIGPVRNQALLFWGVAIGITLLTNLLWNLAKDGSWFLMIGATGHAIVSSIILAASFHFFAAAEAFLTNQTKLSTEPTHLA